MEIFPDAMVIMHLPTPSHAFSIPRHSLTSLLILTSLSHEGLGTDWRQTPSKDLDGKWRDASEIGLVMLVTQIAAVPRRQSRLDVLPCRTIKKRNTGSMYGTGVESYGIQGMVSAPDICLEWGHFGIKPGTRIFNANKHT